MTGIPSDHPSVSTVRGRIAEDALGRSRLVVDGDAGFPTPTSTATGDDRGTDGGRGVDGGGDVDRGRGVGGDLVRVVVDGTEGYARPRSDRSGDGAGLTGVYDGPELARDPAGDATDRLGEWIDGRGLAAGDPVLVDVLQSGVRYGLRVPGERTVYPERRARDDSLSSIARDLDG